MNRIHVRRPSPALVVATVALIVALGGTSYAAFKLPKNSVGTKQLKSGAVTTKKLANGAVTGAKLKLATLGTVPSASNAGNANTVGGHSLGYAHVTYEGAKPQIDTTKSTAGVGVASGGSDGLSCVSVPFTPRSATGNVDFIPSSSANEVLQATLIHDSGHACAVGQIEVNVRNANTGNNHSDAYYLFFAS